MNPLSSTPRSLSEAQARRVFTVLLLVSVAFKLVFATLLPMTGDEAYFHVWGREPDWGYYDHPPMVGWWLAVLDAISSHTLVLRLPALLVPIALAFAAVFAVRRYDEALAWLAGSLVLLAPMNVWNVAITTDVPLMFFSGLAVLAYARAQRTGAGLDFVLCGLALGGALMSKYFAGLLAIAIFAHSVWRPNRRKLVGLGLVVLASLPAALIQVWWNAAHCWPNLMFNIVNRHGGAGLSWSTPVLYIVSAIYAMSPPLALALLRRRDEGEPGPRTDRERAQAASVHAWLAGVPLLILAALSPVKTIGLHWLASFALPAILWFVLAGAGSDRLRRGALRFGIGFAIVHYVLIAVLMLLPTETFSGWRQYPGLVMTVHADELAEAIGQERLDRHVLASNGYSAAVTLEYNFDRRILVFGRGSSHARHDDMRVDFREHAGRDFLIIRKDVYPPGEYDAFFDRVSVESIDVRGVRFTIVTGEGFRYEAYRDDVLEDIRQLWYQVPGWLPRGPCYFCDRYFPDRACHR
ncbi:MAG: glycosyltransferase family 39 protein [Burkholderiaceae bacterium]